MGPAVMAPANECPLTWMHARPDRVLTIAPQILGEGQGQSTSVDPNALEATGRWRLWGAGPTRA